MPVTRQLDLEERSPPILIPRHGRYCANMPARFGSVSARRPVELKEKSGTALFRTGKSETLARH